VACVALDLARLPIYRHSRRRTTLYATLVMASRLFVLLPPPLGSLTPHLAICDYSPAFPSAVRRCVRYSLPTLTLSSPAPFLLGLLRLRPTVTLFRYILTSPTLLLCGSTQRIFPYRAATCCRISHRFATVIVSQFLSYACAPFHPPCLACFAFSWRWVTVSWGTSSAADSSV